MRGSKMKKSIVFVALVVFLCVSAWGAGGLAPQQPVQQGQVQVDRSGSVPIFRITVVARTTKAINYRHRSGSTKVDFRGTALMPRAAGDAKVESHQGYLEVNAHFKNIGPATQFGSEY